MLLNILTGHTVKNAAAGHSKACVAVTADRRWICTGTPLSNDITDLLGQFGVLQMEPFSTKSWFDARVKTAFLGKAFASGGCTHIMPGAAQLMLHCALQQLSYSCMLLTAVVNRQQDLCVNCCCRSWLWHEPGTSAVHSETHHGAPHQGPDHQWPVCAGIA